MSNKGLGYHARKRRSNVTIVMNHYGEKCFYCELRYDEVDLLVLDHVIPRLRRGPDQPWNLVPCCPQCTGTKSAVSIYERDSRKAVKWEKQIPRLLGACVRELVEKAVRHEQKWAGWNGEPFSLPPLEAPA